MSREIDERIVAMYFDNKNFESGARQTLETLDKLKEGCNMEGVGKGFEAFENVAKKLDLSGLRRNTEKVKSSFQGLGDVVKKVFSTALTPIRAVKNEIDELNGYVRKVFGIDLANKIVGGLENTFRSLTVAPISAGWEQYQSTMDSVKTIMSSTGEDIGTVNAKLQEMTNYANQTIYSLGDMTSNLGKFTNNGVKLEDATNSMIGLANATADAGQGAAQASMAMYNVSQAIGVGKMTTIDWKSLENANIATVRLKDTFIKAAVASNKLETKVVKSKDAITGLEKEEVQYWTKAEKGQKSVQVTVENFRETLQQGWLDKESMMKTFAIYSGQLSISDIAALGFDKKTSEELYQIGQNALEAAKEVRTFTKMMDALSESVQSSWASSFQYIFGDMEEGTNLWTSLNDKIDSILTKGAEQRNNILLAWRGMMVDENGQVQKIKDVLDYKRNMVEYDLSHGYISLETYMQRLDELNNTLGNPELWVDYREIAIGAFMDLFDTIRNLGAVVSEAWRDVFGSFSGDTLKNATKGFREFVDRINAWLGSAEDANSRISKIRKGLSGIFTVLKVGLNLIKGLAEGAWNMVKPLIDPLLNLFAKFGGWMKLEDFKNFGDMLKQLGEKLKGVWDRLTKLGWQGALAKIGGWFSNVWQTIKTGFKTWLSNNGLGGVVEWFSNTKTKLIETWEGLFGEDGTVTKWWNNENNPVSKFFKNVWKTVSGLFATTDEDGNEITMPIVKWFQDMWTNLKTTWEGLFGKEGSVTKWWNKANNPVKKFFSNVWKTVSGLFATTDEDGNEITMPIVKWFQDMWTNLKTTWEDLFGENGTVTKWWNDPNNVVSKFFNDLWKTVSGLFATEDENGNEITMPIIKWFQDMWTKLETTWNELFGEKGSVTTWWNAEDNPIKTFFDNVWQSVSGAFESKDGEDAPIVKFFNNITGALQSAWDTITDWFSGETAQEIKKFFTDAWSWLMEKLGISKDSGEKSGAGNSHMNKSGIDMTRIIANNTVSDIGGGKKTSAPGGELTEEEKAQVPIIGFLERLKTTLETAWNSVVDWPGWDAIGKFFGDMWTWLTDLFNKITDKGEVDADKAGEAVEEQKSFIDKIGEFVNGIIEEIIKLVKEVGASDLAASVVGTVNSIFTSILNIVEVVSGWLERTTNTIAGKDGPTMTDMDYIVPSIIAVIGLIGEILSIRKAGKLATIADAGGIMTHIGGQILKLGAGILLISISLRYLGSMDWDTMLKGAIAIGVLGTVLGVLLTKIGNIARYTNTDYPVTSTERVLSKLITWLGAAGMLMIVMEGLPKLIETLSEAKKYSGLTGDDVMKPLLGVLGLVGGMMIVLATVEKISPKGISITGAVKSVLAAVAAIAVVMASIGLIATGIIEALDALNITDIIDENHKLRDPEVIRKQLSPMLEIYRIMGEMIYELVAGMLGIKTDTQKIKEAGDLGSVMAQIADTFDLEKVSGVLRISSMIDSMSKTAKQIDTGKLGNMAEAMGHLGDALNKFSWMVFGDPSEYTGIAKLISGGDDAYQKYTRAIEEVKMLMSVFEPLSGMTALSDRIEGFTKAFEGDEGTKRLANFIGALNKVLDSMAGLKDGSNVNFNGIDIVNQLYDSIQTAFDNPTSDLNEFNATPVVDAIITALKLGDVAIGQAVHDMVQNGINLLAFKPLDSSAIENATGEGQAEVDDWLEGLNVMKYLNFGEELNVDVSADELAKTAEEAVSAVDKTMEETSQKLGEKYSGENGATINIAGISFDENFLTNFNSQLEELQTELDTNSDYQITVKPILDTQDFTAQYEEFKKLFEGSTPVSMGAVIDIGDQAMSIDDSNIVREIQMLRYDLQSASSMLQSVMYNVDGNLATHIDGVTNAVRNIRLNTSQLTLKDVDDGLYRAAINGSKTGVTTYPTLVFQ